MEEENTHLIPPSNPDSDLNTSQASNITYQDRRQQLKIGWFGSYMLIYQAAVKTAFFTLQRPVYKAGLLWSCFLNVIICYITYRGLIIYDNIATLLEKEQPHTNKRIQNFQNLCDRIGGPISQIMKVVLIIAVLGILITGTVGSLFIICKSSSLYLIPSQSTPTSLQN